MRKIIAIGESVLDTVFLNGKPVDAFVGGRIANAAAIAGTLQIPCCMVSECSTDSIGDIIVEYLSNHHVSTASIDRYPDGSTPLAAIFPSPDGDSKIINYGKYPQGRFNVVWPRIDENDILLFGSLYAIDRPQREQLFELVSYAAERKAIIIYLPGLQHGISYRITHVMPAILENLEIADIVIAHDKDLHNIFPGESSQEAFHNHVEFYCQHYLHINNDLSVTRYGNGTVNNYAESKPNSLHLLGWQAGFTAGVIYALLKNDVQHDALESVHSEMWRDIVTTAQDIARLCSNANHCIDNESAAHYAQLLRGAESLRQNAQ